MKNPHVLSARVSNENFLKVKQLAKEKEQDVSEYILDKLFSNKVEPENKRLSTPISELQETQANAENKRLSTLVFELKEKLTNAEDKGLRYFNEIERLTSEADALRGKLMASQEQATNFKIENESLKPRNSNLQVRLDAEEQISAEQAQEIRSCKDYIYRIEDNLETAKNENTRQNEENKEFKQEIQELKERVKQIDGLNKHITKLQGEIISAKEDVKNVLLLYNGVAEMNSKGDKRIERMTAKHNTVIREMIHKLSHQPESFKSKDQFKFLENEIWK